LRSHVRNGLPRLHQSPKRDSVADTSSRLVRFPHYGKGKTTQAPRSPLQGEPRPQAQRWARLNQPTLCCRTFRTHITGLRRPDTNVERGVCRALRALRSAYFALRMTNQNFFVLPSGGTAEERSDDAGGLRVREPGVAGYRTAEDRSDDTGARESPSLMRHQLSSPNTLLARKLARPPSQGGRIRRPSGLLGLRRQTRPLKL
jgi:hypothetical protein